MKQPKIDNEQMTTISVKRRQRIKLGNIKNTMGHKNLTETIDYFLKEYAGRFE